MPKKFALKVKNTLMKLGIVKADGHYNHVLNQAARNNDIKLAQKATSRGGDITFSGYQPLRIASENNAVSVLEFFLISLIKKNSSFIESEIHAFHNAIHESLLQAIRSRNIDAIAVILKITPSSIQTRQKPHFGTIYDEMLEAAFYHYDLQVIFTLHSYFKGYSDFDNTLIKTALIYEDFPLVNELLERSDSVDRTYINSAFQKSLQYNKPLYASRWLKFVRLSDIYRPDLYEDNETELFNLFGEAKSQEHWPDTIADANLLFLIQRYLNATNISLTDYLSTCPLSHKSVTLSLLAK